MLTSGCSFTESKRINIGDKKLQQKSWADYLADRLGKKLVNHGRGGAGNEYIYNSIVDNLEDEDLVVVLWSGFDRWDVAERMTIQIPYLIEDGGTTPRKDELIDFTTGEFENSCLADERVVAISKSILSSDFWDYEYQIRKTIRWMVSLQTICESKGIPLIQSMAFIESMTLTQKQIAKTMINFKPFYELENTAIGWPFLDPLGGYAIMDKLKDDMFVSEFDQHPNEKGHKYISELLYDD